MAQVNDAALELHEKSLLFICGLYLTDCDYELEKVRVAELSVGDISVAPASTARNLGVLFDRNLKFDAQITKHVVQVTTICTI